MTDEGPYVVPATSITTPRSGPPPEKYLPTVGSTSPRRSVTRYWPGTETLSHHSR